MPRCVGSREHLPSRFHPPFVPWSSPYVLLPRASRWFILLMHERSRVKQRPEMEKKNRRNLLLALIILLVALGIAVVKNRDFWFGADDTAEVENAAPVSAPQNVAPTTTAKNPPVQTHSAPAAKKNEVVAK